MAAHLSARVHLANSDQVRPCGLASCGTVAAGARLSCELRRVSVFVMAAIGRDQRRRLRARDISDRHRRGGVRVRPDLHRQDVVQLHLPDLIRRKGLYRAAESARYRQLAVPEMHGMQAGVSGHQRGEQLLEGSARSAEAPRVLRVSGRHLRVLFLLLAAGRHVGVLLRRQLDASGRISQDGIPVRKQSDHGRTVFLATGSARDVRSRHAHRRRACEFRRLPSA